MTKAVSAKGANLAIQVSGSTWTTIGEVKSIPEIGKTAVTIVATSLESEIKEYIPDIPDWGSSTLDFTCNAIPSGETNSNIDVLEKLDDETIYQCRVMYPLVGKQYTFPARVLFRMGAGEVSSVQDVIVSLVPCGAMTFSAASNAATLSYVEG